MMGTLTTEENTILEKLQLLASKGELVGEFEDIPNEVYHNINCPGISKTSLDMIDDRSFSHYEHRKNSKEEPSKALLFGCAFHDMVLEPDVFVAKNTCENMKPEPDFDIPVFSRKKTDQEAKSLWLENVYEPWKRKFLEPWNNFCEGKKIWKEDDWNVLMGMKKEIDNHEVLQAVMSSGKAEVTYFWIDEKTGLLCKCRPDWINKDLGILLDLKTTMDASMQSFRRSISNFKYDKQASFYLTGVNKVLGTNFDTFVFGACEKPEPYGIAIYNLDEASIDVGKELWRRSLDKLMNIKKGKIQKTYPRVIQNINLPAYAFDIESR